MPFQSHLDMERTCRMPNDSSETICPGGCQTSGILLQKIAAATSVETVTVTDIKNLG